ncbi:hypothetical protein ACHAQH_006849 [Verticillium albo-atrum]
MVNPRTLFASLCIADLVYSTFTAVGVAQPDFTNTEPASRIGPFPQWGDEKKIVAMDPWGHLAPWLFKDTIETENEAVKEAQNGGSGVVIYFRKEGRALGEVTKYHDALTGITVVYNARKRGEDRASDYFRRTENIAGVKDMRFQALMPDVLHWLGIKKIDRMLSMSK